jgi:hypothetical protein
MSTAKTFFEWWVPYFSGYCIMKEMKEAYFSSIFLNNFFGVLEGIQNSRRISRRLAGFFFSAESAEEWHAERIARVVFLLHFLSGYFLSALCAKIGR